MVRLKDKGTGRVSSDELRRAAQQGVLDGSDYDAARAEAKLQEDIMMMEDRDINLLVNPDHEERLVERSTIPEFVEPWTNRVVLEEFGIEQYNAMLDFFDVIAGEDDDSEDRHVEHLMGFVMGGMGGALVHTYRAIVSRRRPRSGPGRFKFIFHRVRRNFHSLGLAFFFWGSIYTLSHEVFRKLGYAESSAAPAAGFATGAILGIRAGIRAAIPSGIIGFLLLGMIGSVSEELGTGDGFEEDAEEIYLGFEEHIPSDDEEQRISFLTAPENRPDRYIRKIRIPRPLLKQYVAPHSDEYYMPRIARQADSLLNNGGKHVPEVRPPKPRMKSVFPARYRDEPPPHIPWGGGFGAGYGGGGGYGDAGDAGGSTGLSFEALDAKLFAAHHDFHAAQLQWHTRAYSSRHLPSISTAAHFALPVRLMRRSVARVQQWAPALPVVESRTSRTLRNGAMSFLPALQQVTGAARGMLSPSHSPVFAV